MKIKLLNNLENALSIIYTACRTCYSSKSPLELFEEKPDKKLIETIISKGHLSVLEHVVCNFAVEGVSRSLLAQLTRHRLCSFSVQSQRYCKFNNNFTLPEGMENDRVYKFLEDCQNLYEELIESGIKKEDARAILPNATCTNLVITCNLRELIHICNLRLCKRAQEEIRMLVSLMADEVIQQMPIMSKFLLPKCSVCSEKCQ